MIEERLLIDDGALSDMARELLWAGRAAEPSEASRQRLLEALTAQVVVPPSDLGTRSELDPVRSGVVGKAGRGAWKIGSLSSWAALGVLAAAAAIGASYAIRSQEPSGFAQAGRATALPVALPGSEVGASAPAGEAVGSGRLPPFRAQEPARPVVAAPPVRSAPAQSHGVDSRAPVRGSARAAAPKPAPAGAPAPAAVTPSSLDTAPSVPADTQLAEELRELEAVRGALRAGNEAGARALLAAYFGRFPRGYLAPEARRLDAQLCSGPVCPK